MNADQVFADTPSVHEIKIDSVVNLLDLDDIFPKLLEASRENQINETYDMVLDFIKSNIIQCVGDKLFAFDAEKAARLQAKVNKSPVWFYVYNHKAYDSINSLFNADKKYEGKKM